MNKITKKLFSNLDQIDFDKVLSVDLWDQEYLKRETIKQKIFSFKLKNSSIFNKLIILRMRNYWSTKQQPNQK